MKKTLTSLIATTLLASTSAIAAAPVMFSTLDNFNAPKDNSVTGVRLAVLHGHVDELKGLDLALLGMSETNSTVGVNLNLVFGANKVNQSMKGASFGLFNWNTGETIGLNLGGVNVTNDVKGVNASFVNYSTGDSMVDLGLVSLSEASTVQVGIFNNTEKIRGVQVGLINCASNGFVRCFPLFNFGVN
ncbi:VC2662 family protein [Vibrio sp. WXL103]|uniref:VC2662 family protein n=1 Tax=unclassified Vibrio TaxID=2614977 RepID=UPI003EC727C0